MKSDKANKTCFDPEADKLQVKTKKEKRKEISTLNFLESLLLRRFGSKSTLYFHLNFLLTYCLIDYTIYDVRKYGNLRFFFLSKKTG